MIPGIGNEKALIDLETLDNCRENSVDIRKLGLLTFKERGTVVLVGDETKRFAYIWNCATKEYELYYHYFFEGGFLFLSYILRGRLL